MWGEELIPQPALLPLADVVVTHAGNNTTTECFHFGRPMVALPLFWDQYDNAQRVAETGYGIRLATYDFEDGELLGAVDRLARGRGTPWPHGRDRIAGASRSGNREGRRSRRAARARRRSRRRLTSWRSTARPTSGSTGSRTTRSSRSYLDQDGLRMHYVDEGERRSGPHAPRRADVGVPLSQDDPDDRGVPRAPSPPTTSASAARTSRRGSRTTPTTSTTRRSSASPTSSTCARRPSSSRTGAGRSGCGSRSSGPIASRAS